MDAARLRVGLRRGLGPDPRRERVHRGPRAVGAQQGRRHGRGRGRARRLPRDAAHRRAARVAGDPERGRPSCGAGSACPAAPKTNGCPAAAAWGLLPAGLEAREGRRRCSRDEGDASDEPAWVDAHCHLQLELGETRFEVATTPTRRSSGRAARASSGWCASGTGLETSRAGARARGAPRRRVRDRRPAPARRVAARRRVGRARRAGATPSACVAIGEAGLRPPLRALARAPSRRSRSAAHIAARQGASTGR